MTQDIDERAKINTSRSVAAMIAIGVLNIITVPLISKFGSHSAKAGYLTVAVIYGCIFTACHFFCFAKTKEAVITPEKRKNFCKGTVENSHAEQTISSCIGRTDIIWIYIIW